jgi:hypothetical protein
MSEESGGGFLTQIKNQVIAGVGVVVTTLSTVFIDEIKSLVGIKDEVEEVATQEQVTQPEIIINIPEQKKDTVVKKVYVEPKKEKTETEKRKDEGLDW